jgi:hypothetical protein
VSDERDWWSELRKGVPRADLVHAVVDKVLLGDPRIGLVIDRLDEGLAERGSAGE